MSAFKKLNRQDVFVTSYTSKKEWQSTVDGTNITVQVSIVNETGSLYSGSSNYSGKLKYRSLQHLYYSNFSGSIISGSYENYIQSSLESGSRELNENGNVVLSISRNLIGQHIEPHSFKIEAPYTNYFGTFTLTVTDNGEGKLLYENPNSNVTFPEGIIGDIVYTHGIVVLNEDGIFTDALFFDNTPTISWQSNYPILTQNVICKVSDFEFNFTQNPSAVISGSFGKYKDNITGSDFRPYITAVGLYNDANELIAVAKLGQPLPKPSYIDTTFIIKLDI